MNDQKRTGELTAECIVKPGMKSAVKPEKNEPLS